MVSFTYNLMLKLNKDSQAVYEMLSKDKQLLTNLQAQPAQLVKVDVALREDAAKAVRRSAAEQIKNQTHYTTADDLETNLKALLAEVQSA